MLVIWADDESQCVRRLDSHKTCPGATAAGREYRAAWRSWGRLDIKKKKKKRIRSKMSLSLWPLEFFVKVEKLYVMDNSFLLCKLPTLLVLIFYMVPWCENGLSVVYLSRWEANSYRLKPGWECRTPVSVWNLEQRFSRWGPQTSGITSALGTC